MAQQGVQLDQDQFCCSVCLDLLKEPVAIPCGHTYCLGCITDYWDNEKKRIDSCPQCRMTFIPRPVLKKNTMLAEVIEQLKKTGLQAAPPDHSYAGPGDVACDFCTGRKQKALKSCLVCLSSYCETHLRPHYDVAPLKKHKLVKASTKLQENICSHHDEAMKIFCRTDQQCICYLCSMDEHKGHDTVSAAAERTERQKELGMSQHKIQQGVQVREREIKELQQAVDSLNRSADKAVEESERVLTEFIRSIQRRCSEVKELIRAQQKTEVTRTEELRKRLEQELTDLRRRDTELEQLSHTEDHIHFLQSYPSLYSPSESTDLPNINVPPLLYFADVTEAVSKLRNKLEDFLKEQWPMISTAVNEVDISLPLETNTRADFLRYSRQITLDQNTAHKQLSLSEGNRKVRVVNQEQPHPNHPERFTDWCQILGREDLTGGCYWEVELSGAMVSVAVSYKDIHRTGNREESILGYNPKSWALECRPNGYVFRHNNIETQVSGPHSSRIGVYLDHRAGTVSFYSISDTMTLLHRVQTTFTQPLYAGFWLPYHGSTAELCKLTQGSIRFTARRSGFERIRRIRKWSQHNKQFLAKN